METANQGVRVHSNPFSLDITGTKFEVPKESEEGKEATPCPYTTDDGMLLQPDLGTLRNCNVQPTQALVIADPMTLDGHPNILSPRQILKNKLATAQTSKLSLKMSFSVNFQKNAGKDDTPSPFSSTDFGAIKSNWAVNITLKNALDTLLRGMGIPVVQIEQLNDQKLQFTIA